MWYERQRIDDSLRNAKTYLQALPQGNEKKVFIWSRSDLCETISAAFWSCFPVLIALLMLLLFIAQVSLVYADNGEWAGVRRFQVHPITGEVIREVPND